MDEVKRLQEILYLLRSSIGWTGTELGFKLGISRQQIYNLEHGLSRLSKAQYITIRCVLDYMIEKYPEKTIITSILLTVIVDEPEKFSEADKSKLVVNLLSYFSQYKNEKKYINLDEIFNMCPTIKSGTIYNWKEKIMEA